MIISDNHRNLMMDSSDEDFLPDPENPVRRPLGLMGRKKKPPDKDEASSSHATSQPRGLKRKHKEDFTKGKCFFISFGDS